MGVKSYAIRWYTTLGGTVGIVALAGEDHERWFKVYIGVVPNFQDESTDTDYIAQWGMPIHDEVMARHLFWDQEGRTYRT